MITIDAYEDYFEDISKKVDAASFYPVDMAEFKKFEEDIRGNKIKSPAFVLEDFIIKGSASNNDQVLDIVHGAVLWLQKIKVRGDVKQSQLDTKKETFLKIQEVKNHCIADRRNFDSLMYWLNVSAYEIDYSKIADDWIGYRYEFELRVPID